MNEIREKEREDSRANDILLRPMIKVCKNVLWSIQMEFPTYLFR